MKTLGVVSHARQIQKDPIGFILDRILSVAVNMLIPIPLAGEVAAQFKVPLLSLIAALALLAIFMMTVLGTVIALPFISGTGYIETLISNIGSFFPSNSLNIAPDTSFVSTNTPKQNPFGGSGMSFTNITAYFHDPDYFLKFGKWHTGLDLVPSDSYFQNSKTYKDAGKVAIFATINGTVNSYVDQYGGETVEITNPDNTIRVKYIHFSTILVSSGQVSSGTPIGIMGETGFATGVHVHYEIQTNDNGTWIPTNPLNYIQ